MSCCNHDEADVVHHHQNTKRRLIKVRSLDFTSLLRKSSSTEQHTCASQFSKEFSLSSSRSATRLSDCLLKTSKSESSFHDSLLLRQENNQEEEELQEENFWFMNKTRRRPALGCCCLSALVLLLACAHLGQNNAVQAHLHQLGDALSMEVITPPFLLNEHNNNRPRLGLGTAAIGSITETFSPILPFTGGVDLRREEHWQGGWFSSVSDLVHKVRGQQETPSSQATATTVATSVPRGGGNREEKKQNRKKRKAIQFQHSLSTPKPFLDVEEIAKMSLTDVTRIFEYAVLQNRPDFDLNKFTKGLDPSIKKALTAMDAATAKSRGPNVQPALTEKRGQFQEKQISDVHFGNVDALQFCAAMRIFAEWRVVRQVPHGYKGYAVGMNLGHKDVVQNVHKIESAIHEWINEHSLEQQEGELRSPTLRELLQHEVDTAVHPGLPRLKEKTAAMGLLWVRRQLSYQTALFANVVRVPDVYKTTTAAVAAAYKQVYDRYHGWAVQKIFNYSFQAAPDAEEIYKFMNPNHLKRVVENAKRSIRSNNKQRNDADSKEPQLLRHESMHPLERLGRHIGSEWDKLVSNVVSIFDKKDDKLDNMMRGGGHHHDSDDDNHDENTHHHDEAALESYIRQEMSKDAHQHILVYLDVAQPLLSDLAGLFDDLNMDDPSKV